MYRFVVVAASRMHKTYFIVEKSHNQRNALPKAVSIHIVPSPNIRLYGDEPLAYETNCFIFNYMQKFIIDTNVSDTACPDIYIRRYVALYVGFYLSAPLSLSISLSLYFLPINQYKSLIHFLFD